MTDREAHREGAISTAGKEAIGALSRIDGSAVLTALAMPHKGQVFDLGLEINSRIPHNPDFVRFAMAFTHTPEGTGALSPFQFSAETIFGPLHISTHIDSFIHIQKDNRIYGGHLASDSRDDRGWTRHGIETVPPILGRAILLDIPRQKGLSRLEDRYEVTIGDIEKELARKNLEIRSGDIVMVRTGKIQDFGDESAFQAAEPGVGRDAALWLYDKGMAVLGTDTTGTEPLPFADPTLTTHAAMLVDSGVHLIENLNLEDVAENAVAEGLFIALPLKITGATGSWIRPVLVV
jgi:kynurenine formamidase